MKVYVYTLTIVSDHVLDHAEEDSVEDHAAAQVRGRSRAILKPSYTAAYSEEDYELGWDQTE